MYFVKKKKRKKSTPNRMFNWVVAIIIGLAALKSFVAPIKSPDNVRAPLPITTDTLKEKSLSEFKDYKEKILPYTSVFHVKDTTVGTGTATICGQEVTIAYQAFKNEEQTLDDHAPTEKPLTFRIGDHHVMPALEQGVVAMQPGGKRTVFSPMSMSYGIAEYARPDVDANAAIAFEVELLKATPEIPDIAALPFRIASMQPGNGIGIGCGEQANVQLIVWNADGTKRFSSTDPISFTTGASEVLLGLDQGVLGMKPGEKRSLFIPPALQKTLNGKASAIDIPLPKNEPVLIDVEIAP